MDEMSKTNDDFTKHSQFLEQEQLLLKENLLDLQNDIKDLHHYMTKPAIAKYEKDTGKKIIQSEGAKKKRCVIS